MQVFKAILDVDEVVALKVLSLEANTSPTKAQLRTFQSEVRVMRACRHQNVVSFLGSYISDVSIMLGLVVHDAVYHPHLAMFTL